MPIRRGVRLVLYDGLNELDVNLELHLIAERQLVSADRKQSELDAELASLDRAAGTESGVPLSRGREECTAVELDSEGDRAGDPVEREISHERQPVVTGKDRRGHKLHRWIGRGIEEVRAPI